MRFAFSELAKEFLDFGLSIGPTMGSAMIFMFFFFLFERTVSLVDQIDRLYLKTPDTRRDQSKITTWLGHAIHHQFLVAQDHLRYGQKL